jgi:hypothetical protein
MATLHLLILYHGPTCDQVLEEKKLSEALASAEAKRKLQAP